MEKKIEKLRNPHVRGNEGCFVSMIDLLDKINEVIDVVNGKPELRESEDERIRKALIDLVSTVGEYYLKPDSRNKMLAWLEKQKEQKPNIELIQRSWYMEGYHDREFRKEPKWILKTGEGGPYHELNPRYGQPLADEKKEQDWNKKLCLTCQEYEKGFEQGHIEGCTAGYNKAMKEMEQKGPQEIGDWRGDEGVCKKQKEQNPVEWSEEDEKRLNAVIELLENTSAIHPNYSHRKLIIWLQDLRPPTVDQIEEAYMRGLRDGQEKNK